MLGVRVISLSLVIFSVFRSGYAFENDENSRIKFLNSDASESLDTLEDSSDDDDSLIQSRFGFLFGQPQYHQRRPKHTHHGYPSGPNFHPGWYPGCSHFPPHGIPHGGYPDHHGKSHEWFSKLLNLFHLHKFHQNHFTKHIEPFTWQKHWFFNALGAGPFVPFNPVNNDFIGKYPREDDFHRTNGGDETFNNIPGWQPWATQPPPTVIKTAASTVTSPPPEATSPAVTTMKTTTSTRFPRIDIRFGDND